MELSEMQIRLILAIHNSQNSLLSYSSFGTEYNLKPYAVSRIASELSDMGMLNRTNVRRPVLTPHGAKFAEHFLYKMEVFQNYLRYEGMSNEERIKREAFRRAMEYDDEMFEAENNMYLHNRLKSYFNSDAKFMGTEFCEKIKNGTFSFSIIFEALQLKEDFTNWSMANDGFQPKCKIVIKDGKGYVLLFPKMVASNKTGDGHSVSGQAAQFQYHDDEKLIDIQRTPEGFRIPLDKFRFRNIGDNVNEQILHGQICIQVTCTSGEMGIRKAMLTVLVH